MTWMFLPPVAVSLLAGIAVLLVIVRLALFAREGKRRGGMYGALVLRFALFGVIAWLLLNPTGIVPRAQPGRPKLLMLVDTSRSMAVRDAGEEERLRAATAAVARAYPVLARTLDVGVRTFDERTMQADVGALGTLAATGPGSDLPAAIRAAVDELQQASESDRGVVILSDGQSTEPGIDASAEYALSQGIPVWSVTFGGAVARRDVTVEVDSRDLVAFADETVHLGATLRQEGYPARRFLVNLVADGAVCGQREVEPGADGSARIEFSFTAPKTPETRLCIRVEPMSDESDASNNEQSVFLRTIGGRPRLLIAEGQPHWDTKFLVQSLNANPHVSVTAVYRVTHDRHVTVTSDAGASARQATDRFPRTADELAHYDMILLGKGVEAFIDAQNGALLTDWIARGGRLVFTRGKAYGGHVAELSRFEPVLWADGAELSAALVPSVAAEACPAFRFDNDFQGLLDNLPRLDMVTATQGSKALTTVWAESAGQRNIIMASSRYGLGSVLTFNAGGFWRWAFHEKRLDREEFAYDRFWSAVIRWMLSEGDFPDGSDLAFSSERRVIADTVPLRFLVRARGEVRARLRPEIRILRSGENEPETTMIPAAQSDGVWTGQAGPFAPGLYTAELVAGGTDIGPRRIQLEVAGSSRENRNLSADGELLRRMAELTQAHLLPPEELESLADTLRTWHAERRLGDDRSSLWDRWWIMVGMVVLMGGEWYLRRREGLL